LGKGELNITENSEFYIPFDFNETENNGIEYKILSSKMRNEGNQNNLKKIKTDKIKLFIDVLNNKKLNILPLPLFEVTNSNIYKNIVFHEYKTPQEKGRKGEEKEDTYSLLNKLKQIYNSNNKPFNYILFSRKGQNENIRFENVINFDFKIDNILNDKIYDLEFNKYFKDNKEELIFSNTDKEDKNTLLFDLLLFFGTTKQDILFNPEIKNNPNLNQLLLENHKGICNLIYKNDNTFLQKNRFKKFTNKFLNLVLKTKELKERFKKFDNLNKVLLIYLKYEETKKMAEWLKKIETEFEILRNKRLEKNNQEEFKLLIDKIEISENNDKKVLFLAGQIIQFLTSKTSFGGSQLEHTCKYILNVNNFKDLKIKILFLEDKYSSNKKYKYVFMSNLWKKINKLVLSFEIKNEERFKDNLIPFFVGFYSKSIFYMKNGDKSNDDEENKEVKENE
jgi:hypothetical protein